MLMVVTIRAWFPFHDVFLMMVNNVKNSDQVADEEALPWKLVYGLQSLNLRLYAQLDTCHSCWNDSKNSVRRGAKQYTLYTPFLDYVKHGSRGIQKWPQHAVTTESSAVLV